MKFPFPKRNLYFNIPNYISFFRVAIIPVVMLLMGLQNPLSSQKFHPILGCITALLFVLAAISDLFDGWAARKMQIVGTFGKFLDPVADKLIHMAVLIMLIPLQELPAWMVVLFLFRELSITALRSIAAGEGMIMAADVWGKKKTALLNVALTCFLLPPHFLYLNARAVGWVVLSMALVLSLGSGYNYVVQFLSHVQRREGK